jgi:hypothetical protein
MADPKLKLGNDIWATKQKSLLAYNDEGGNFKSLPFQVDRISGGTYVGRNGLVQSAASNEPRVDFLNNTKGALLLEPQRTNNQTYSEQFDNSAYFKYNSMSVTSNDTTAPNGTLTADKIISDGSQSLVMRSFGKGTIGSVNTFSVWAKKGNFDKLRIDLADSGGQTFTLTDEWQRVSITITPSNDKADFEMPNANNGDFIYLWGAQIEVGSYPTSYIPTSGGAVTRGVDSVEYDRFPDDFINSTEGTLFVDFEYLYETTTSSSTDGLRDIMVLGTSSDISEGISIDNYRSQFRVFVQGSGMSTQILGNNSTGAAQPNTRYKLAVKYKTGDCKAYLNGSLLGSGTGTVNFVADLDGFFFSYNSSSRPYKNQKHVYDLQYFDEALSDSELATLTTI